MKRVWLIAVCLATFAAAGCSKRQAAARIVFAQTQPAPPAAIASPESTGALVVAEPQPPEPEEETRPPEPEPAERPKPRPRPAGPGNAAEPVADPAVEPAPAAEVPALEPLEGPAQQAAQRQETARLLDQVRARIARQERSSLSASDRRMVADARTFLSQSERALSTSDFQRALTLARKASMLLAVVEQQ